MPTVADITTVTYSGDPRADALLGDMPDWNYLLPTRTTLYYTFDLGVIGSATGPNVTGFNTAQRSAVAAILDHVSEVCGIDFEEVASGAAADLHFGACDLAGAGVDGLMRASETWSTRSDGQVVTYSADAFVYLDNAEFLATNAKPVAGSLGYQVLLHEIGHALGLAHPFEGPYPLADAQDHTGNTVMSYNHVGDNKSSFQAFDLLALRWIYGDDGLRGTFGLNSTLGPSLDPVSVDTTAPTVVSFEPADEATGVAVDSPIVLRFSEDIQRGTGAIVLRTAQGSLVETFDAASSMRLLVADRTLSIDPTAPLAHGSTYRLEFAASAVTDLAGNAFAGTSSYNFATAVAPDSLPPTVAIASDRTRLAAGETAMIGFTLSEDSGNFVAGDITVAGGRLSGFVGSGRVYSAVFTPATDSVAPASISIASGRFTDAAGNPNGDGADADNLVRIAVDTQLPEIAPSSPPDAPIEIGASQNIVIGFSEAVQRGVGLLTLKTSAGTIIEIYSAATSTKLGLVGHELSVDSTLDLTPGAAYALELAAGSIRDLAGNGLARTTIFPFRAAPNLVTGSEVNDTLAGTLHGDLISGLAGNDILDGKAGDDTLDGGAGVDRAQYGGLRADARINKTAAGHAVSTPADGSDDLIAVERVRFDDVDVALDTSAGQAAGNAVLLLGAALPGRLVFDPSKQQLLGAVIDLFDAGYSLPDLSGALLRLPVWDVLTGQAAPSHRDIASYLLTNVHGTAPNGILLDAATHALDTESFQGSWLAGLASSGANELHVGLAGLAESGLEYLPLPP